MKEAIVTSAVEELIRLQECGGSWPYAQTNRARGKAPLGVTVGSTALVCQTILYATDPSDEAAECALDRGLQFIIEKLAYPHMSPTRRNAYDVRIWGHIYSLDLFCRVRSTERVGTRQADVDAWIPKLVQALIAEEVPGGGWNYASRRRHACFVTAPAVQALLLARSQGECVPAEILDRSRDVLLASRLDTGAYWYSVTKDTQRRDNYFTGVPGSIARAPLCETTLTLLGAGKPEAAGVALDNFHKYWGELEKRRQQRRTHAGPHGIAPYYFYFGHRYAAQAIALLPHELQSTHRETLCQAILRTQDTDRTWNDMSFPQSRGYSTAMAVMTLLADSIPLPPGLPSTAGDQADVPRGLHESDMAGPRPESQ